MGCKDGGGCSKSDAAQQRASLTKWDVLDRLAERAFGEIEQRRIAWLDERAKARAVQNDLLGMLMGTLPLVMEKLSGTSPVTRPPPAPPEPYPGQFDHATLVDALEKFTFAWRGLDETTVERARAALHMEGLRQAGDTLKVLAALFTPDKPEPTYPSNPGPAAPIDVEGESK